MALWYWGSINIRHRSCQDRQRIINAFQRDWSTHLDPGQLCRETLQNSLDANAIDPNDRDRFVRSIQYACSLANSRVFCSFHAPTETEIHIACNGLPKDVLRNFERRLSLLLDAIQLACVPQRLRWIRCLPKVLRRRFIRPEPLWPLAVLPNPVVPGDTWIIGKKINLLSAINLPVVTALAGGSIAGPLAHQFGTQSWPLAFSPLWVGLATFLLSLVWTITRRFLSLIDWKVAR